MRGSGWLAEALAVVAAGGTVVMAQAPVATIGEGSTEEVLVASGTVRYVVVMTGRDAAK